MNISLSMYDEKLLEELHEKFRGAQDEWDKYDGDNIPYCVYPKYDKSSVETRTFTFNITNEDKLISHEITCNDIEEGYTNLKITPAENLEKIDLLIGGQRLERNKLFRKLKTDPTFFQMSNGKILPALELHTNEIILYPTVEGTYTISYDVLKNSDENFTFAKKYNDCTNKNYRHTENAERYYQEQNFNKIIKLDGNRKFEVKNINFNHPIVMIYVFITPNPEIEDIRLILDDIDYGLVATKKEDYYCFYFGDKNSINFSRIQYPTLSVTLKEELDIEFDVDIYGIGKQIIRRMQGMCGSAFAK